jgi:hypothetical protein
MLSKCSASAEQMQCEPTMKITESDLSLDVRIPLVMLQQQARGEITTSMMTAMMWLRSWSNWKTGNVEHSSAGGIRTATGRAFSVRTFQSAMKKLEQMGWITRHTVKGSHQDYGVTLHNYKYVDEDGKVLILNPKPLTIAPKKSRARKTRALRKTAEHPVKTGRSGQYASKPCAEEVGNEAQGASDVVDEAALRAALKENDEPHKKSCACEECVTDPCAEGCTEASDKILYYTNLNTSAPDNGENETPGAERRTSQASLRTTNPNSNPNPLPEPFEADENNRRYAKKNGLNLQGELDGFVALHGSIGSERKNWQSVFRRHLVNAVPHRGRITPPDWVPAKEWTAYLDMRERIGRGLTVYAQGLIVKKLDHLRAAGEKVATVLMQSTAGEWTDVYKSGGSPPGQKPIFLTTGSALDNMRALEEKYQ